MKHIETFGLILLASIAVLILGCSSENVTRISSPSGDEYVVRGRELARGLAACGFCHGETKDPAAVLSGGLALIDKYGQVLAPNLTSGRGGISDWDGSDIVRAVRAGLNRDRELLSQEAHEGFGWMSDRDVLSIAAYLKSLPAIDNEVPRRAVSFVERNTLGFLDRAHEVAGFVPHVPTRHTLEYGQYLTDHVARCATCHSSAEGVFSSGEYLVGGNYIRSGHGEKVAPGITADSTYGIGAWSEDDIVKYLQSGITPSGDTTDPDFCPTRFFRNAQATDLAAIAKYLKSIE